jgi:hypothetical protein
MYNNKSADAATTIHHPAGSIAGRSNGGGSVYKGNIYDIPYAHTKYAPISLSDTTASDSPGSVRPPAIDAAAGSLIPLSERPVRRLHELQASGGGGGSGRGSLESATRSGRLSSCANSPRSNPKRIVTINQRNIQYSTQYPDL